MKFVFIYGSSNPAIVDDEDLWLVLHFKWHLDGKGYPMNENGVRMHRLVGPKLDSVKNETHHKDHNKLNNQKENLVAMANNTHQMTRGKQKNNKSGYKGVSWKAANGQWVAQISICKKRVYLGLFSTAEEAAREYDRAAKEFYGETAQLNFPTQ